MIWRAKVRGVRRHDGALRWTLVAATPDLETLVHVDTTERGGVIDIQSDEYAGTSGDPELDDLVVERVQQALASRDVSQMLDGIDRQRWGRVQQPRDRGRWAA